MGPVIDKEKVHVAAKAAAEKATTLLDEFKRFAFKGNLIDLAVGVIIGTAFGKLVDSLVKDVIMPLVGVMLPGDGGYVNWKWVIREQEVPYGRFLGEVAHFLIVALAIFLFIVKFLGWVMRSRKEEAPAAPTKDQELLTEIRDLLKQQAQRAVGEDGGKKGP